MLRAGGRAQEGRSSYLISQNKVLHKEHLLGRTSVPGGVVLRAPLHVQRWCSAARCKCHSANLVSFLHFPTGSGLPVCTWTALREGL